MFLFLFYVKRQIDFSGWMMKSHLVLCFVSPASSFSKVAKTVEELFIVDSDKPLVSQVIRSITSLHS